MPRRLEGAGDEEVKGTRSGKRAEIEDILYELRLEAAASRRRQSSAESSVSEQSPEGT